MEAKRTHTRPLVLKPSNTAKNQTPNPNKLEDNSPFAPSLLENSAFESDKGVDSLPKLQMGAQAGKITSQSLAQPEAATPELETKQSPQLSQSLESITGEPVQNTGSRSNSNPDSTVAQPAPSENSQVNEAGQQEKSAEENQEQTTTPSSTNSLPSANPNQGSNDGSDNEGPSQNKHSENNAESQANSTGLVSPDQGNTSTASAPAKESTQEEQINTVGTNSAPRSAAKGEPFAAGTTNLNAGADIVRLYQNFTARTAQMRNQVLASRTLAKAQIAQNGNTAIQQVQVGIQSVIGRLVARFTSARQQITAKSAATQGGIQQKGAQSNETYSAHQTTVVERVGQISESSSGQVRNAGTQQAAKMQAYGNNASSNVASRSNANATKAVSTANRFAGQHSGDHASEGASAARGHGTEMAKSLREQGELLKSATMRDSASMSNDLITGTSDAATQFEAAFGQIGAFFSTFTPIFGGGVGQLIQLLLGQAINLETASTDKLNTVENSSISALNDLFIRFSHLVGIGITKGQTVIDRASDTQLQIIDDAEMQVFQLLDGVPADPEGQFQQGILEIQNALTESLLIVDGEVNQASSRMGAEMQKGGQSANTGVEQLNTTTQELTGQLESKSLEGFDQLDTESSGVFDRFVAESLESLMQSIECIISKVTIVAESLIEDLGLAEEGGEEELDARNDAAIEEQDSRMFSFAEYLRDEVTEFLGGGPIARRIVSIILLPVALLEYFVGVIAGIIWAILKFIGGLILLVVGLIAAILAIAFLAGALFVILFMCVGLIPAIILTIAAVFIALVLLILAVLAAIVIGFFVMIATILMNLYKAFTDPTIGPFERGFLIGESIGDILLLLLPFKAKVKFRLPAWVTTRITPLLTRARFLIRLLRLCGGNVARLVRLVRLFGNDLVKLERFLIAFGDARMLENVVVGLGGRLGGGVARLERVFPHVDSVLQLARFVRMIRNGARLEALLTHVKIRNAAQLEGLLLHPKVKNALQLENLLNNAKLTDAEQLILLLTNGKVRSGADLLVLLNNRKITSVDELMRIVELTENTGQVRRMIRLVDTAEDLELYLIMAGGETQAGLLAQLLRRAVRMGDYKRIEGILNIASGNAAKFEQLGSAVGRFGLRPAPGHPPANLHGYDAINVGHFQQRHSYEFFDFGQIKGNNTFWPQGTNIVAKVDEALTIFDNMVPPYRMPAWKQPPDIVTLSDGTRVQIACNNHGGNLNVGQFFPQADAGLGIINFVRAEMEAIAQLLIP
ncbi:MAG: hypothetical protein KTR13_04605 [Saprospiraceae bacterium]|nr:hypothetical protein [Saprospiraceae bacterium]